MKLRALLFLSALAIPLTASADIEIQCSPAPTPPPSRFDWMFPKTGPLTGREANWTHAFVGRLWLQGLRSYSTTGHVPDTGIWKYLQRQHDRHPAAFNATHPYFQGLFNAPDTLGELPGGKFWEKLEDQYENRPIQFDRRYPYLTEILERDRLAGIPGPTPGGTVYPHSIPGGPSTPETPGLINPPEGGGPTVAAVPEPASIVLAATGLGALALIAARTRKRSGRA